MIDARELRIGNWVIDTVTNTVGQVKMISPLDNDIYKPIELTPEILEKCGVVKDDDGCYRIGNCLYYIGDWVQIAMGYTPLINCPCKYIHQLQNLVFAIYGEELDIKL